MLTGGMGYSYKRDELAAADADEPGRLPGERAVAGQTNKQGGLIVIAPNVQKVATGYTGAARDRRGRPLQRLPPGARHLHEDAFHAGQRNDATTCSWCHNPNKTSTAGRRLDVLRARDPRVGDAAGAVQLDTRSRRPTGSVTSRTRAS
jgi:hypothetical protein